MQRPPMTGQQSFTSSDSVTSFYSLRGMEQPIPSFKSSKRAVGASSKVAQKPLPPVPRGRRASSVYSQYTPKVQESRRPSSEAFYLQPYALSHSGLTLTERSSKSTTTLHIEPKISNPVSPDLYFALEKPHKPRPPLLLEAKTYSPSRSPLAEETKKTSTSRDRKERPRSLITPRLPLIKTTHTEAIFNMTVEALDTSPSTPKASPTFQKRRSASLPQHAGLGPPSGPFVKNSSRDKAKIALGIDFDTLRRESGHRRHKYSFNRVHAAPALSIHSVAGPRIPALSTPTPRDSQLLSIVIDSYIQGFEDDEKPEAQLYAEDYHSLLSGLKNAELRTLSPMPATSDTRLIPVPLFWQNHVRKESTNSKQSVSSSVNFSRTLQSSSISRGTSNSTKEPPWASRTRVIEALPSAATGRPPSSRDRLLNIDKAASSKFYSSPKGSHIHDFAADVALPERFRFTSIKDRKHSQGTSTAQKLVNTSKTLLSLKPTMFKHSDDGSTTSTPQVGILGDTYDYNKPIPRPAPQPDQEQRIHAALEKVKDEVAAGVEGAMEILRPVWERNELPAEKEDPFGIERTRMRQLERKKQESGRVQSRRGKKRGDEGGGGGERGRVRQPSLRGGKGGMSVSSSGLRSKSERRREDLKKRIKVVGAVDPNINVGVGIVGGAPAGYIRAAIQR